MKLKRFRSALAVSGGLLLLTAPFLFAQDGEAGMLSSLLQSFTLLKVWLAYVFALTGLVLLIRAAVTRTVRTVALGLVLFMFGIAASLPLGSFFAQLGMHPSPICMLEKPFIFLSRGQAIPLFFVSMIISVVVLNIIGNKLFCGWVCPLGALQELMHRLPVRKIKIPFKISNSVRIVSVALFFILLFAAGTSIYTHISGFEFFHFDWGIAGIILILIIAAAALFVFRPFCYFLCPMGLFTWLIEHIAVFRVFKTDKSECGKCRACVEKSPCPGVQAIVDGKWSRPDCHACGACIDICPNGNLEFTVRNKRKK